MEKEERIRRIERAASELLGEVEWFDVAPCETELRSMSAALLQDAQFLEDVRAVMRVIFERIRTDPALVAWHRRYVGHQEIELEAVGVLQSSIVKALQTASPACEQFFRSPLVLKVRRFPHHFMQAPVGSWVPSMAEQMGGKGHG
jgi:hypothetical protein